ncbi:YicC/YloC family endoribonuclease [Ethanoligenens harbinense]|uniref:YicC-like domain-containing protein n=1 Tax=Ethanoligenens harbinense (strain DSM 18485 / JCM 12961 / CGMCC 1.5033 / YUAN-3) TaxID=663278 RepID=E6U3N7_ETHHY|nr:YicC/YloC family endoribonuclease [Ethanoligenens harbinense]ADU27637.1 YicC-like domain-containing protein [Ethanoligenens harbinense YUAN-3]AVQ96673.1 YicC family protein [Ethanoligenens harbinense YUAN-3]AYF39333.1 YicC family protein [Ethanoligenens harbinense]AYF42158.1 YicC family protein [Ethanoligenens harbinense]QCN92913.1 YicC family protein [Ethanoligenens harbinense]
MIRSMTGYGRVQQTVRGYRILLEIKAVNHRFFEFSARVPRLYGYLEEKLRTYVQRFLTRGKVEAVLTVEPENGAQTSVMLNTRLAASYINALRELQARFNLQDDLSVSTVARYADLFSVEKAPENEEDVWEAVREAADTALEGLVRMREAEGARLQADITARAERIRSLVEQVEQRSPQTVAEYRARLSTHMRDVLADAKLDENRILLEAAIYADKVSVAEETVRLKSHLAQFAAMLEGGEPVGRKLDFLMQEMNREANTIGSKASDVETARVVVEIKAELEKIREQIQNIE